MKGHKLRAVVDDLHTTAHSNRRLGRLHGIAFNAVRRLRLELQRQKLDKAATDAMDDAQLYAALYKPRGYAATSEFPDLMEVHELVTRDGLKLIVIWTEKRLANPRFKMSYAQFTYHYRRFVQTLDLVMRQTYRAGEFGFVDYAGKKKRHREWLAWVDPVSGERHEVELFVAVLGFSMHTFACTTASQATAEFADAHVRWFEFMGAVPEVIVSDNLKAAVVKPGSDPEINRAYAELGRHYGVGLLPTRALHPKDKAKVEQAVQFVQRWIVSALRNQVFHSQAEIDAAIRKLLPRVNLKPFKRLPGCRQSRFEEFEKPLLNPLPATRYEVAEWVGPVKVGPDYHVWVKNHAYSVPYTFAYEEVEARLTLHAVEIFRHGRRIASHLRGPGEGGHTTLDAHRTPAHQAYASRTAERYVDWAQTVGPATVAVVQHQYERRKPAALGAQACDGLQRLAREYGPAPLEAACRRAQTIGSMTLTSVRSMLRFGLIDADDDVPQQGALPLHDNVRGERYYAEGC